MIGRLDESARVTLNASGAGTVTIGPRTPKQKWRVRNLAVSGTGATTPEARVYFGPAAPGTFVAGTYSGNSDNVPADLVLWPGQVLTVAWTGGTAGATCTVSILGELETV
jgi:hypothetical protein